MKILEVIPISKGITMETLTYFTGSDVPAGSVVKVPLRKKAISAIVLSVREAEIMKSEIKKSAFSLKKIEKIKHSNLLRKEFVEASVDTAEYYAGFTGAVLGSMIPKVFFENLDKLKIPKSEVLAETPKAAEKFAIQSNDEDRYAHYKSIIREEFAKNYSVFFCLPTIQDIKKATETLKKGIEHYTFTLHGLMKKKEIIEITNKILKEKHPILIIATGAFLSIPKEKIGTIIIDKENSRAYKQQTRPYIDIRNFAEAFANKIKAKIIFGDLLLRAETIYRYKKGELIEIAPLKFRSLTTSNEVLIDMKQKKTGKNDEKETKKDEFRIFSPELEKKIKENIENNEHMFIFTARRGLSPSTLCSDCGNIVKCNSCGAHVVLHLPSRQAGKATENFFLCHRCGERRSANEKCVNCGGWKLATLGIGAELIEEKLKEMCPKCKIWRLDADVAKTHKKAGEIAEKFYNSPESILIGTEMALLYLSKKVENSAVVSMDTFFSIPDFRVNEKVLNILLKIRAITDRSLIIQTRDSSQKVFNYALTGNLIDFFKDEIDDRKALGYPPFSTLIKISVSGSKEDVLKSAEDLQKTIEPYEMDVFPAFIPQKKGKCGINGIIKIPGGKWPDKNISEKLKYLPMNFSVNVDPDSLL